MKKMWFVLWMTAGVTLGMMVTSQIVGAHQPHAPVPSPPAQLNFDVQAQVLKMINENYVKTIKPIFVRSCFDCHSDQIRYPQYYKIPGVKQFIDQDIAEAKEHMEMSHDFPFAGHHGSPLEQLNYIKEEVEEGEMPPWRYWIFHREARLTAEEKKAVSQWVDDSKARITGTHL